MHASNCMDAVNVGLCNIVLWSHNSTVIGGYVGLINVNYFKLMQAITL